MKNAINTPLLLLLLLLLLLNVTAQSVVRAIKVPKMTTVVHCGAGSSGTNDVMMYRVQVSLAS